jgi:hypothetical protein
VESKRGIIRRVIIADAFKLNIDWRLLGNLLVSAILGGGIGAAIFANIFAKRRDRENRRIEFLKKMGRWRTKVYQCNTVMLRRDFSKDVADVGGEYVALERDLRGSQKEKFHRLCDEIVAMKDSGLWSDDKAKLLERIEEIIRLIG